MNYSGLIILVLLSQVFSSSSDVEISKELEKIGDEVSIINTKNTSKIIEEVNSGNFDAVHLHYDQYANIMHL